jgi:hypothetical protein
MQSSGYDKGGLYIYDSQKVFGILAARTGRMVMKRVIVWKLAYHTLECGVNEAGWSMNETCMVN